MKIREKAKGRWPEILDRLIGGESFDGKHHPCPKGEGKDRFRFSDVNGCGSFFCACSNGEGDGFDLLQCVNGWDFAQAAKEVEEIVGKCEPEPKRESWAEKLRREVVKTKQSAYLAGRGLEVAPGLDWHKSLPYYSDGVEKGRYPAMLAPVFREGKFVTYHVTYLDGGKKAPVDPCRKILPGSVKGAACPLYPAEGVMGIAEGVETAIAAKMMFGMPVWAALNTSMMKAWKPPEFVHTVKIFADHDESYAGHAAAYSLAEKLHGRGIDVEVKLPEQIGDWNDVLQAQSMGSHAGCR